MTQLDERITTPERNTRLFDALAYAGVVPFILGIYMEFSRVELLGVDGRLLFSAYSACILSFLCGIWWGGALNRASHPHRMALALLSNLVCLGAWVGLMLYRLPWGMLLLTLGFAFTRWAEARLNPNLPGLYDYFRTRSRVSYIVIACHLVMLGAVLVRTG
ncbi:DUF3429 domain-containing protein [Microbulbifer yueqingensis]|uniref:DUF3429 domain-containing protein n=1 Tax=Microbulbifer yueqingensis TaxID=658219 RepID=A0A1G9ACI7_9GAMM|nr:DUF3429 domain-containing protein [Microbulbifer yueqingensis]SDK24968.1 Protein of unknown function [Microbulbifer yueqingensis]